MMKRNHTITFLIWLAVFNWPPVLGWVPFLQRLCFLSYLFWINIPAKWCGLGNLMGERHYMFEDFGVLPQTRLSWILIVMFWVVMAVGMTVATAFFPGLMYRKNNKVTPNKPVERTG